MPCTIDETLLYAWSPAPLGRLDATLRAWEAGAGVPVGLPLTTRTTIAKRFYVL